MSLEDKLKAFQKTARFRELVAEKMKTDPNFGSSSKGYGTQEVAVRLGEKMKEFLRDEIFAVRSSATGESFLDHIIVRPNFIKGAGWTIDVSFDDEFMHRESLYPEGYPDGVELDVLFNEGFNAGAYAFGEWHGENVYSRKQRDAEYFVQRAVDRFNIDQKGKAVAQYNSKYTGGTL